MCADGKTVIRCEKIKEGLSVTHILKGLIIVFSDRSKKSILDNYSPRGSCCFFSRNINLERVHYTSETPTKTVVGVYAKFGKDEQIKALGLLILRKPLSIKLENVIFVDCPAAVSFPVLEATYENKSYADLDISSEVKVTQSREEEWSITEGYTLGGEITVEAEVFPFKSKNRYFTHHLIFL